MSDHPRLQELLAEGREDEVFDHAAACDPCQTLLLEEGAYPFGCRAPRAGYVVLLHLDLLAEAPEKVPANLREHLLACPACHAEVREARTTLEGLEGIDLAQAVARVPISLGCVFCHDQLQREAAAFCAACLAPHHPGCFDEHGRCAVLGCEETRTVRPSGGAGSDRLAPQPGRRGLRVAMLAALALTGLAGAALLPSGPARPVPGPALEAKADPVIARIDREEIRLSELELACSLDSGYRALPPGDVPNRLRVQLRELDALIEQRLLLSLAREKGVELTEPEATSVLAGLVVTADDALSAYRKEHALAAARSEKLLGGELGGADVTERAAKRYYDSHQRAFTRGGETRLQEIVIYANPGDAARSPEAVKDVVEARELALRIEQTEPWLERPFAECVELYSMGAELGEQIFATDDMREVLVPPLGQLVNDMREGEISPLVECYTGSYHFVKLVRRTAAGVAPFSEVVGEIREVLEREATAEARRALIARLRAAADIETFLSFGQPGGGR